MLFVTELNICSGIEEVITSTTGNRVAVLSGPRVRIPPCPPSIFYRNIFVKSVLRFFIYEDMGKKWGNIAIIFDLLHYYS